jgi:hypothetical protein
MEILKLRFGKGIGAKLMPEKFTEFVPFFLFLFFAKHF